MQAIHERHELGQYFFDQRTNSELCSLVRAHTRPLLIGVPTLARALADEGRDVLVFDIDDRFSFLPGYKHWDLHSPTPIDFQPSLIFCDPPYGVTLSELFRALSLLAGSDFTTPVALVCLTSQARAIESALSPFNLRATGYRPSYQTVQNTEQNEIQIFANFPSPLWPAYA